ncbi:hypothetical protein GCM10027034_37660 [Ramlibacter solisilvae]
MSPEHVDIMNTQLAASEELRASCARLPKDLLIAYRLVDEDTGAVHWWQLILSVRDCVYFTLEEPASPPSVTFESGYWAMLEGTMAQREGRPSTATPPKLIGDPAALEVMSETWGLAQRIAKVDVEMPTR